MTIDQVYSEATKWLKRAVSLCLNVPTIPSIPLTQAAGIGMAGLGFLLSKL